jgi:hypothetical protein
MCAMKLYRSLTGERVVIDVPVGKARLVLAIHNGSHPGLVYDTALTLHS